MGLLREVTIGTQLRGMGEGAVWDRYRRGQAGWACGQPVAEAGDKEL